MTATIDPLCISITQPQRILRNSAHVAEHYPIVSYAPHSVNNNQDPDKSTLPSLLPNSTPYQP